MKSNVLQRSRTDRLVLGRTGRLGFFPKFSISEQVRKFHMYVVGLTGRGKSKFLQNCLVQDIMNGRGCAVIDPHGDLAKDVIKSLYLNKYFEGKNAQDQILYVAPRRRDLIVPFNVLKRPDSITETYEISQRVISAFMRTWARTLVEPPRFQQIMRASLAVLIETGETLMDLYQLLTDDAYREDHLERIPNLKIREDCTTFFRNEFDNWGRDRPRMIGSTTNKISALRENPSIYNMLSQKENLLDLRDIMETGKVLIVDLGDCDDETKRLFGTLVVTGFEQAALSRSRSSFEHRKPYFLYVDEFQDFACQPGAAETFSQMLSQVRKFGLHMILANQSIAQLNPRLQTALGNAQTIIAFRISRADAEVLSRILGHVDPQQIKHNQRISAQHPLFSPLNEQWEGFIQHLTRQSVRQATIKTADDRLAVIWSEKVQETKLPKEEIDRVITELLKRYGFLVDQLNNLSNHNSPDRSSLCVFAY